LGVALGKGCGLSHKVSMRLRSRAVTGL
jgi:hypothetical protein